MGGNCQTFFFKIMYLKYGRRDKEKERERGVGRESERGEGENRYSERVREYETHVTTMALLSIRL